MARITVEDCIDKFPSRFELVLVASHRARKLHSGDETLIEKDNDKNTVIALREIADSSISVEAMKENLIQEYQTVTISDEEDENLELELGQSEHDEKNNEISKKLDSADSSEKSIEVEMEMKDLIASEDSEIKEQLQVDENLEEEIISEDENVQSEDENVQNVQSEDENVQLDKENL